MSVGDKIKREREKRGWTKTELAKRAGVSKTTITYLERNTYSATEKTVLKLAKALRIHPGILWY